MSEIVAIDLSDEDATIDMAARLAPLLRAGDILLMHGDLGAGKTTFTRGLVRGLESPAAVSSPTFTLIHEYPGGRLPVIHVDAYRLSGPADADSIGLTDYLNAGEAVIVIEWPERLGDTVGGDRLEVTLGEAGDGRRLLLQPVGDSWKHRSNEIEALACGASCC